MSSLDELLGSSRRRRGGTLVFWFLVLLAALGIAAVWIFMPKQYRASTIIQIDPAGPREPMTFGNRLVSVDQMNRAVADHISQITSESVLHEALKSMNIMQTAWYQAGLGDVPRLLDELKNELKVEQVHQAEYIIIAFRTRDPSDAAVIVNAVTSKYLDHRNRLVQSELQRDYDYYRARTSETLERLRRRQRDLQEFVCTNFRTPGISAGVNIEAERYRFLTEEVTALQIAKLRAKARYENLKGLKPQTAPAGDPEIRLLTDQDPQVGWLRQEKLLKGIELEALLPETPENEAQVKALQKELSVLQAKLNEVLACREKEEFERRLKSAEQAYLDAAQAEVAVRELLTATEARVQDIDRKMVEYSFIEQDIEYLTRSNEELSRFTNKLGILVSGHNTARVRQLGSAQKPSEPDREPQVLSTLGLLGVPLVYGVLLVLTRMARAIVRR